MRSWAAIFLMTCCAAANAAEVYKWVDSSGRTHFGDRPKHDAKEIVVKPASGPGAPDDPEAEKIAAIKAKDCETRKKQLESYRRAPVIKEVDGLGKEREYTPDEKAKLILNTEKQVAAVCGAVPEPPAGQDAENPAPQSAEATSGPS